MNAYELSLFLLQDRKRIEGLLRDEFELARAMNNEEAMEFLNNALAALCVLEFPSTDPLLLTELLEDPRTQEALNCTYFKEYHIEH